MESYPVRILHKEDAERLIKQIGVEDAAVPLLIQKALHKNVLLKSIKTSWANILKQEMLSCGGDAAIHRGSYNCSKDKTDVLLMGTLSCYNRFITKMKMQPECFSNLVKNIEQNFKTQQKRLKIGTKVFELSKDYIVLGILNVTPDSFSDGGLYNNLDSALKRSELMLEQGADFIDVGGESTRPGSVPVSLQEEMDRVLPVIEAINKRFGPVTSVDSYKEGIIKEALKMGVKIVNDINNGESVLKLAKEIVSNEASVIAMMNRTKGAVQGSLSQVDLNDPIEAFLKFSTDKQRKFCELNFDKERLIVDPGIGFGLSDTDIKQMLNNAEAVSSCGIPVCWGISRKSFIQRMVKKELSDRDTISNSISLYLLGQGVRIFRTHSVEGLRSVIEFYDNFIRGV